MLVLNPKLTQSFGGRFWKHQELSIPSSECDFRVSLRVLDERKARVGVRHQNFGRLRGTICLSQVSSKVQKSLTREPLSATARIFETCNRTHEKDASATISYVVSFLALVVEARRCRSASLSKHLRRSRQTLHI